MSHGLYFGFVLFGLVVWLVPTNSSIWDTVDLWFGIRSKDSGASCENFFLSDGRSPIEIPETWGEARSGFQSICEMEGVGGTVCCDSAELLFKGYPDDDTKFDDDRVLCMKLQKYMSSAQKVHFDVFRRPSSGSEDAALLVEESQRTHSYRPYIMTSKGGAFYGTRYGMSRAGDCNVWDQFVSWGIVIAGVLGLCCCIGSSPSKPLAVSAKGAQDFIIRLGSRVTTQWTRDEGGNDQWYLGTVVTVFADGDVKIRYDDRDFWTGPGVYAYPARATQIG